MAAGAIARIGTDGGPCKDSSCGHTDCTATRAMADSCCIICGSRIGYGRRFYKQEGESLVHAVCLEEKYEAEKE